MKTVLLLTLAAFMATGSIACGDNSEAVGQTISENSSEIVGGSSFRRLPAVGALLYNGAQHCTGTAIGPRTVLTAAHCVSGYSASRMKFVIGSNIKSPTATIQAVSVQAHPDFDPYAIVNDIGLVTLVADAPVEPLGVLTEMDDSWIGRTLLFVGYGVNDGYSQKGAGIKRAVSMSISELDDTTFAYDDPGRNTCNGDSGGPALFKDTEGIYWIAGVTSYGDRYCIEFGVDTRVDPYLDFLGIDHEDPVPDPCQGETAAGRCEGNTVVWCELDQIYRQDCEDGTVCMVDAVSQASVCSQLPPADDVVVAADVTGTASERNNARLIVQDHAGTLHLVFYGEGILHSFSRNGGATWSTPTTVAPEGRQPSIAVDSKGVLHLVYKNGRVSAHEIIHRSYAGSWSPEELVHYESVATVSRPSLAIGPNDEMHCVWQLGSTGARNSEIQYKKFVNGVGWDVGPRNVSQTVGASEYPTVATDSKGGVFVFWKDSGENVSAEKKVLFRKYSPATGWDSDYENVSNTVGNDSSATMDPSVVVDSNDNLHLVWKDAQLGNREIFYKKFSGGVWDSEPTVISNTESASDKPVISVDGGGNLYVVWIEKIGLQTDVVWAAFRNGAWSDFQNVSNTTTVDSVHPSIPKNIGGFLPVLWTETGSLGSWIMFERVSLM